MEWLIALGVLGLAYLVRSAVSGAKSLPSWADPEDSRSSRVSRACEAHPVVEIAAARGKCRVAGSVIILDPVEGYPGVGAFFTRSVGSVRVKNSGPSFESEYETRPDFVSEKTSAEMTKMGRIAVCDSSGVAIVEGVAMVWALDGPAFASGESGAIQIREGTLVHVIGEAAPVPMPSALASRGSYRGGGTAVSFRGTKEEPVFVLAAG